jgi:outer membrane protein insertion porin family
MVFILLLGLIWGGPAFTQRKQAPAPKPPTRWPIETLSVEGNHNYSKEQLLAVAGLKIGQVAGKEEFEAAQKRLEATGAFETVGFRFAPGANSQGYAAAFQVVEVEPVYPVRFEELGVPAPEVEAWLRQKQPLFAPKIAGTKAVLDRYVESIQQLLAARSRPEKIVGKLAPVGPDQYVIVFRPARLAPAVAEINFAGNSVIPANLLREAISGVAVGTLYSEPNFRELLNTAVRPLYDARGRIRVAFPKITTEQAKDVEGLVIRVSVDEGPSFELGDVAIDNKTEVKSAELLKLGDFKKGDLANFDQVNEGVERIKKRLRRQGYMRAAATVERKVNDEKKTVDLVVHINEGAQFVFGKLNIEGLDLHGEAAIKKLWSLKEGKPFNAEYPDYFLTQVQERGLFDNLNKTRSAIAINEKEHTVDVTLSFR